LDPEPVPQPSTKKVLLASFDFDLVILQDHGSWCSLWIGCVEKAETILNGNLNKLQGMQITVKLELRLIKDQL
jgi:hypothetical protein